ncbi:hypothetical protein TBCH5v1_0056 [Thermococcus barophilus]|uniref:Uncharacterized protein n=2 Tax=Thermococcus barophilus TaxID=55802 RepID=A0A0S1X8I1_THEBA|nr:hypothetical protein TBCH5v1_0056 [Thermococcus barophilus]
MNGDTVITDLLPTVRGGGFPQGTPVTAVACGSSGRLVSSGTVRSTLRRCLGWRRIKMFRKKQTFLSALKGEASSLQGSVRHMKKVNLYSVKSSNIITNDIPPKISQNSLIDFKRRLTSLIVRDLIDVYLRNPHITRDLFSFLVQMLCTFTSTRRSM